MTAKFEITVKLNDKYVEYKKKKLNSKKHYLVLPLADAFINLKVEHNVLVMFTYI